MRPQHIFILIVFWASVSFAKDIDSSELIFDDTKVHEYSLHFYIENWAETLKINFEEKDKIYMPVQLTYGDMVLDSIGVRYKGNSSYTGSPFPKKPFKFDFDKYKNQTFFGIDKLNFANGYKDPSFLREKIGYDLIRRYMPAPRAAYATISIEGELIGFYTQVEQVERTFLSRYFENTGFNLYKALLSSLKYWGEDQSKYENKYELKTNDDINDWSALITMLDKLNDFTNIPDSVFVDTIINYLNLDKCIRYLAYNMVLSNFDSYACSGRNFYLYDDSVSGQFDLIPWDLNMTFGTFATFWKDVITQDVIDLPNLSVKPLCKRILENDSLTQVYLIYIQKMINGPCSYDSIAAMADLIKPLIDQYVQADTNKLYTYQDFIDNIENDISPDTNETIPGIKSFSLARNANLQIQLDEYLNTDNISSMLKIQSSNRLILKNFPNPFNFTTTIYYTVDRYKIPVRICIYNSKGVLVRSLFEGKRSSGMYECLWDAASMSPGVYLIRLDVGDLSTIRSAVLTR